MEQGTYLESLGSVFQTGFWKKQASLSVFFFWYEIPSCRWNFYLFICLFFPSGLCIPQQWEDGLGANCKTRSLKGPLKE